MQTLKKSNSQTQTIILYPKTVKKQTLDEDKIIEQLKEYTYLMSYFNTSQAQDIYKQDLKQALRTLESTVINPQERSFHSSDHQKIQTHNQKQVTLYHNKIKSSNQAHKHTTQINNQKQPIPHATKITQTNSPKQPKPQVPKIQPSTKVESNKQQEQAIRKKSHTFNTLKTTVNSLPPDLITRNQLPSPRFGNAHQTVSNKVSASSSFIKQQSLPPSSIKPQKTSIDETRRTLIQRSRQFKLFHRNHSLEAFVQTRLIQQQQVQSSRKHTNFNTQQLIQNFPKDMIQRHKLFIAEKQKKIHKSSIEKITNEIRPATFVPALNKNMHIDTDVVSRTTALLKHKQQFVDQQRKYKYNKELTGVTHKPQKISKPHKIGLSFYKRLQMQSIKRKQNVQKEQTRQILLHSYSPITNQSQYKNPIIHNKLKILKRNETSLFFNSTLDSYRIFEDLAQKQDTNRPVYLKYPDEFAFMTSESEEQY